MRDAHRSPRKRCRRYGDKRRFALTIVLCAAAGVTSGAAGHVQAQAPGSDTPPPSTMPPSTMPPSTTTASTPKAAAPKTLKRYRATLYGLPPFDCVSVDDLGVILLAPEGAKNNANSPSNKPDVLKYSRILDLKLERRFTMDREFHHWIQTARAGRAEPRDGVVALLSEQGDVLVRFRFYQAKPKRWEINIPPMDAEGGFVTETVTLEVQDMEMEY